MDILKTEHLSKTYDGKYYALSDVSFSLKPNTICAIVGESGSGKSTLLRLIAGLERSSDGSIFIKNEVVNSNRLHVIPQERPVGMVFQDFALFPHLTVEQNIAYGISKNKKERVTELLKTVQLSGYERRYPSELSGGQQQRVALARTLARSPELLLLDEPFSNLDAHLKAELRQTIRQIVKSLNLTMIFITHDIYDAIDIADELIFLKDGQLLEHCSIGDLFENQKKSALSTELDRLQSISKRIIKLSNG